MSILTVSPTQDGVKFAINLGPREYRRTFSIRAAVNSTSVLQSSHRTPDAVIAVIEHPKIGGRYTIAKIDNNLAILYGIKAKKEIEAFDSCVVRIHSSDGMLLLPGDELPFDPADYRHDGRAIELKGMAAWALSSQAGFLVQSVSGDAPDTLKITRAGEKAWDVALQHKLSSTTEISGTIGIHPIPYNGAITLDSLLEQVERQEEKRAVFSVTALEHKTDAKRIAPGQWHLDLEEQHVEVSISADEKSSHDEFSISAQAEEWETQKVWKISVKRPTGDGLSGVRIEANTTTSCANPTWNGDATVVIPGNMGRCNYHPDHLHGGGPKWGPSPLPERESNTANDEAPGRCHGWTFAASRLPQVWAAAVDRNAKQFVWIGAEPHSKLGECCAGFVSPENDTTKLKLATPTTYEPWVPLGYSRMRREPRRDTAVIHAGEPFEWSFYIAVRETDDLNAWAALDRALYLRNRPKQPTPFKMPFDEAAKICAAAIYERFYDKNRGVITYSTGPQGQNTIVGFTGMAHSALVMLRAGDRFEKKEWTEAGRLILGTVAQMFIEGPEFPWTAVPSGKKAAEAGSFVHGSGEPGYVVMAAFDSLAEAYLYEKQYGRDVTDWKHALKKCADAWVNNQSPEGAYPHWGPGFADAFKANEYNVTNVEAGVLANMADAYEIFGDECYLESAKRAAKFYGDHLDNGQLWGGPGDIRALVNSEVPMFFLRGYRRLYEVTGDEEHKRLMLLSAAWRYSFQFAHSWPCEPGSPLYRQGWAGLGSENASACNLHSVAFGCINVPDMWALWKITGDEYHRMRCEDLAGYSTQQYARFAGDLGFPFAGAGTESWWTSDSVWGKGYPWIFTDPGFDLGYMSWVTGWSGYGALWGTELFR